MPFQTTLKRQAGADVNFSNDDLDENEYEVSWGSKKARHIYNNLTSPDLYSKKNDSVQTESVYSQLESTIEVEEEFYYSSDTCSSTCEHSDCNYQTSSQSDDTDTEDTDKEIIPGIENGYLGDENLDDSFNTYKSPPPPFFQNCVTCKKENINPHYQSCYNCFKVRMQLVEIQPNPVTKRRLKHSTKIHTEINDLNFTNSQESSTSSFQETNSQESSGTFGLSGLLLANDTTDTLGRDIEEETCNTCLVKPKNGFFNHKNTSHNYCCYSCSKRIWRQTGKCPICNLQITNVTKRIFV